MIDIIHEFIRKITNKYPALYCIVVQSGINEYKILHNSPDLEFKDEQFASFSGELLQKVFFENGIYNVQFTYSDF